jgi:uncharacterized protein YjcR
MSDARITKTDWSKVEDLHTAPIEELAARYGVQVTAVQQVRRKHLAGGQFRPPLDWDRLFAMWGDKMPAKDADIAERLGVRRNTVTMARKVRGIKSFTKQQRADLNDQDSDA